VFEQRGLLRARDEPPMSAHSRVTPCQAQGEDTSAIAEIWYLGWRDGHLGSVPSELIAARHEASFHSRAAQRTDDTVVAVSTAGSPAS
jgi:hypothetical protein